MRLWSLFLVLVCALVALSVPGLPQGTASPAELSQKLDDASAVIKKGKSDIPNTVLLKDQTDILRAWPKVEGIYKAVPLKQQPDAVVGRWKLLRVSEYAVPFSQPVGVEGFLRYGFAVENATGKISDESYVKAYSYIIGSDAPWIKTAVLDQDREVVLHAIPELRKHYADDGFSRAEANYAATWAWRSLRTGPKAIGPETSLSRVVLVSYGQQLGRLKIESAPPGATITVEGEQWPDPTNTSGFAPAGTRTIVLSMPQYETVRESFVVVADKLNEFKRSLKKKP